MSMTESCIEELRRAGLFDKNSDYDGMIGEAVKELLLVFQKQGHSGYSALTTASIFHKLVQGKPLTPLTDDPSEWMEVSSKIFQSTRVSNVFIDRNESDKPYTLDGKAFSEDGGKTYFTNRESRVYSDLPGFPPKTQYVILEET